MNHKVNLQARIRRHSRILKDNLWNSLHHSSKKSVSTIIIAVVIAITFPFYPGFASLMYTNTQLDFYRWDIDETSILSSYDEAPIMKDADTLFEAKDSYLSVWALVEDDTSSSNKMISYDVKEGDTIKLIAQKYDVSYDTIMWENNFGTGHLVKSGDKITFPPVTWVTYKVKRWDTVSTVAKKYSIDSDKISKQNLLTNNAIKPGQSIILPGAKYIAPPKIETPKVKYINKKVYSKAKKKYVTKKVAVKTRSSLGSYSGGGLYPLKWRSPFSGAWGNCTNYVASYKDVDWRWNANQWLYRAKAKGHATWNYAKNGAIIVLGWRGYNRYFGHVAIVRKVEKNHLIVSDMNYRRKNQVTVRKIKRYGSHVRGYIYVN